MSTRKTSLTHGPANGDDGPFNTPEDSLFSHGHGQEEPLHSILCSYFYGRKNLRQFEYIIISFVRRHFALPKNRKTQYVGTLLAYAIICCPSYMEEKTIGNLNISLALSDVH